MHIYKRCLSVIAALSLVLSASACEGEGTPVQTSSQASVPSAPTDPAQTTTTKDPDEYAPTDAEIKELGTKDFVPDGNSGKIVWLGYYDLIDDGSSSEQYKIFTSEQYGGEIEYISSPNGAEYFTRLGTLIASGDSPDIVRYEWLSFPYGMSKNMYEPLDEYIDHTSPLWSDMGSSIEEFSYKGKHYYYPYKIMTNYALNYNRAALEKYSLPDPYDLYLENNWTWDTFRELLINWCNAEEGNIGYAGEGGMSFIATTGTNLVEVRADGTIVNNINSPEVSRAMQFCSGLYRDGLVHQGELGDWVSPQTWAKNSEQLLFLGMNPEWTYTAASSEILNPSGVDNDICGVASDFAFVPYPRDPSADAYNIAYDTYGYLVPKGAKNIKGAVDWINLNRVYQTDETILSTARENAINPPKVTYTSGKYEGKQKWTLVWDERVYDLWQDMIDPGKFNFSFDDCWGFNEEMNNVCDILLDEPIFEGASWAQYSEEYESIMNGIIESYTE